MTATVRVISGPRGSGKTATMLAEAEAWVVGDPGAVLCLVPNRRAEETLREQAARGGMLTGLRIARWGELIESLLVGQAAPSETQRRLLAEEVATEATSDGELSHYARVSEAAGFLTGFLGMVDELGAAGVAPRELARASYRRDEEASTLDVSLGKARIRRDDRERARLYARYVRQLARLGVVAPHEQELASATLLDSPLLEGVRVVMFDGFVDFTPGQLAFMDALEEKVEQVWLSLLDEASDERAEVYSRPRATLVRVSGSRCEHRRLTAPLDRPAGLRHLREQLFRPLRRVEVTAEASGLELIEGPGIAGEVRLVARKVRMLLADRVHADDVVVVARDLGPYADLVKEVFAEYDIPTSIEGRVPLTRNPGVAVLVRALRLLDEDFPFADLTALLRHGHFRLEWEEGDVQGLALEAEALLRLLGEPRGRSAYLAAVQRWAEAPPVGLEDETAEASRRQKTHDLAKRCQAFLVRLFAAFDGAPGRATLAEHVGWVRRLGEVLGITRVVSLDTRDLEAWAALWAEVEAWQARAARLGSEVIERRTFLRRLGIIAGHTTLARDGGGPGTVEVLSAPSARYVSRRIVVLMGLGERGFPRMVGATSLLGEEDRTALTRAGLRLPGGEQGGHLSDEMLLFLQIVTGARERLILSYPAVDERGQSQLPGSFLLAVQSCFTDGAIATVRRSMLLEQFESDDPLSAAEYRVRVAMAWPLGSGQLVEGVRANLTEAAEVARRRFGETEFTPHDGMFADRLLIDWVGRLFGPNRVFSPTALEDYVACPFRFLLRHVLHLEPLDEPSEEVEVTRRGMTYHRALARLHGRLRDSGTHRPGPGVEEDVLFEVSRAVGEDVARAPGPASQALWQLEGERLLRTARRYAAQWGRFLEPWDKAGVEPRPHLFEVDFGLPVAEGQEALPPLVIRSGGVEVRISGRIDRVDVAPLEDGLGFWIIDYKTGRAGNYTGADLAQFRKLQLTLYASAVEEVFLGGQQARPLGLAYWLVSESGTKVALPGRAVTQWLADDKRWPGIREKLFAWVARVVGQIRLGAFPLAPRSEHCTQTCPYGAVCRIGQSRGVGKHFDLPLPGAEAKAEEGV